MRRRRPGAEAARYRGLAECDRERLAVQVLDDSTDDTGAIVEKAGREARTDGFAIDAVAPAGPGSGPADRRARRRGGRPSAAARTLAATTDAEAAPPGPFSTPTSRPGRLPAEMAPVRLGDPGLGSAQAHRGCLTRQRSVRRGAEIPLDGRHSSRRPEPGWATLSGKGRIPSVTALGVRDAWPAQDKGLGFHAGWRGSETVVRPRGTTRRSPASLRPRKLVPEDRLAFFAGSGPGDHAADLGPPSISWKEITAVLVGSSGNRARTVL